MYGKALTYRECVQVLKDNGFISVRSNGGSHEVFKNAKGQTFVLTIKAKQISQKTWKRECRKVGIVE